MKKTITTIILITFCLAKVQAQNVELPTAMTVEVPSKLITEAQKEVDAFRKKAETEYANFSEPVKSLYIEFVTDTFAIELLVKKRIEDINSFSMRDAYADACDAYDALLNKYYKLLLNELEDSDKEKLKQAQRAWIKFRDSDTELSNAIYMSQGSLGLITANITNTLRTKQRTIELYTLLLGYYGYS